ncbi:MAG TPA: hypothetical protein VLA92_02495 [Candidatus Saccharimonadales bacterium]|nr:hypothetical protein [Candidatus Saccharimonadales bacterium]
MKFLSAGDFNFPFDWITYWIKHFYIWSFQSGTPNPDGLIRLPGRVFNFLVFGVFGHIGASYFYIFSTLIIAFVAFYYFARDFLHIKTKSVRIISALFFALNPIFLGNVAKIGLVLAAVLLPLCFLAIQAAFQKRQFRYFLLFIICINISFLHPYTFTVNLGISLVYLGYMALKHRAFVIDNIFKFVGVGIVAVLLNMYFALPMASMGSVSKDMISTNITPSPVDYTALVGISNTGNFFTGFSLSKNVFVDFNFYNATYQNVYFFGVFLFYAILLGLFLYVEKDLRASDRRRLGILFGAFLILIALAATTVMHIDTLIKFLISMPGGWAFRSPLKWQLYIPLALFGILAILLSRVGKGKRLVAAQAGLLLTFVLMNAYMFTDLYRKILVPRGLDNFAKLEKMNLNQKTVLLINNGDCMDYMRENPRVTTELNQVFTSKNTQLKHVLVDNVDTVNLGSYNYVLSCKDSSNKQLNTYNFAPVDTYANGTFRLFQNRIATPEVYTPKTVFGVTDAQNIGDKYNFAVSNVKTLFNFAETADAKYPTTGLQDVFENLQPKDIKKGKVQSTIAGSEAKDRQLFMRDEKTPLFYTMDDSEITVSTVQQDGMQRLPAGAAQKPVELPGTKPMKLTYDNPSFDYKNLIKNPSFENGLWQKKVTDCYNFDKNPDIGMKLDEQNASHGSKSLELDAKQHIACTGPGRIKVKPGEHYLLSFDYQSEGGKYAGFYASFDDPIHTTDITRMQKDGASWQTYSKELTVPKDAQYLNIMLYAYPHTYGETTSVVHYDDVSLVKIPAAQNSFYVTSPAAAQIAQPKKFSYTDINPTKRSIHVKGASKPFYVATVESYNPLWKLEVANPKANNSWPFTDRAAVSSDNHMKLNNTMNGWYVDPQKLCAQQASSCQKNSDGSYDMELVMEFMPQRWFYLGAIISTATFIVCTVYYIRSRKRSNEEGGYRRW